MICHLKAWPKLVSAIGMGIVGVYLLLPGTAFAQEPKLEATLRGNVDDDVDFLAFSPDGKTLAQAGCEAITLWGLATSEPWITLKTRRMSGSPIAFSPDSKTLGVVVNGETIKLYNVATGENSATFVGRRSGCMTQQVAFSPDGKILATYVGGGELRFWDVNSRKNIANAELLNGASGLRAISFTRNSKNLVAISPTDGIQLWDAATGKKTTMLTTADMARIEKLIGQLGSAEVREQDKAAAEILDMGPAILDILEQAAKHQSEEVKVRAAKVVTLLKAKDVSADGFTMAAISMDCKTLATRSLDPVGKQQFVRLWEVATGKELNALKWPIELGVRSLVFSPSGKMLAAGFNDGTIKLWDLTARKEVAILKAHATPIYCLAFSPDSKTLASGDTRSTIKLWEIAPAK